MNILEAQKVKAPVHRPARAVNQGSAAPWKPLRHQPDNGLPLSERRKEGPFVGAARLERVSNSPGNAARAIQGGAGPMPGSQSTPECRVGHLANTETEIALSQLGHFLLRPNPQLFEGHPAQSLQF